VQLGGRYFFTRNDGLQNQNVLYRVDELGGEPQVVLDPNTLSHDGTIALTGWNLSEDGKLLAYGLSSGGSDWQEWHVREVESGRDLADHLRWVKFSGAAWTRSRPTSWSTSAPTARRWASSPPSPRTAATW